MAPLLHRLAGALAPAMLNTGNGNSLGTLETIYIVGVALIITVLAKRWSGRNRRD